MLVWSPWLIVSKFRRSIRRIWNKKSQSKLKNSMDSWRAQKHVNFWGENLMTSWHILSTVSLSGGNVTSKLRNASSWQNLPRREKVSMFWYLRQAVQTWKLQITSAKLYFSFQSLNVLVHLRLHTHCKPENYKLQVRNCIFLFKVWMFWYLRLHTAGWTQTEWSPDVSRSSDYHLPLIFAKLLL